MLILPIPGSAAHQLTGIISPPPEPPNGQAYEHSLLILEARDGERLVGIIRVVGDGYSIVFIQDILVHPEYQRRGIGTQLLRKIMELYSEVYQMELMTDDTPGTISFYQSMGLWKADDVGACAFVRM